MEIRYFKRAYSTYYFDEHGTGETTDFKIEVLTSDQLGSTLVSYIDKNPGKQITQDVCGNLKLLEEAQDDPDNRSEDGYNFSLISSIYEEISHKEYENLGYTIFNYESEVNYFMKEYNLN